MLASGIGIAQDSRREPLPVETALSERSMGLYSKIRLSPDEKWVAYTVCDSRRVPPDKDPRFHRYSRTGALNFGLGCDVWVTDTRSGESRNLTDRKGSNWGPSWSPDGSRLAFYSDRSGTAALWVWEPRSSLATAGPRRLSDVIPRSGGVSAMAWTSDSRSVVIPVLPEGMSVEQAAKLGIPAPQPAPSDSQADAATVTVFRSRSPKKGKDENLPTAAWSTELERADLALVDASTGSVRRLVTGEKPAGFWISPDGSRLACLVNKGFASAQSQQQLYTLDVVALTGGARKTLVVGIPQIFGMSAGWSPDGKSIAYLSNGGALSYLASRSECFVVSASGGPAHLATEMPHPTFGTDETSIPFFGTRSDALYLLAGNALWKVDLTDHSAKVWAKVDGREVKVAVPAANPDSVLLVTRSEETKDEGLYEVTLATGVTRKVWEGPRSIGRDPAYRIASRPGSIVLALQDAAHGEDLWIVSGGTPEPRRLTHVNPDFDRYAMGKGRLIEWLNDDGVKLHGAILLPAGYEEGKRYPMVVFVYGGGLLSNSIHTFGMRGYGNADDNFQLLATRGFAVLLPDAPSDWKDQMRDLPKNILPGVNRAIEIGIADPDRLGIMGHSNGGFSTLALITLTTRFKAAVMRAGMGSFMGLYGELGKDGANYGLSVAESAFSMGTPWTNRSRYIENSPIFHLDRVETPLLIIHGSEDTAVAPFLADEVFVDLRRLGKEVVYARYEGEGHSIEGYANQVDYCTRMIAWFEEHLHGSAVQ